MERKLNISVDNMCRGLPDEISTFLNYSRALIFEEKPDYSYPKKLFKELFIREHMQNDFIYDWIIINDVNFYIGKK